MIPGMGAVATTLIAGVEAVRRGLAKPIGSSSQMSTIRLGKRTDARSPLIKDFVPLAALDAPNPFPVFSRDSASRSYRARAPRLRAWPKQPPTQMGRRPSLPFLRTRSSSRMAVWADLSCSRETWEPATSCCAVGSPVEHGIDIGRRLA